MVMLTACSHVAWWRDAPGETKQASVSDAAAVVQQEEDAKAVLKRLVQAKVSSAPAAGDARHGDLVYRKPYYFKEYGAYPGGADSAEPVFTEVESRTAPLMATVKLAKLRFSTRLHQKKEDVRDDNRYIRETGVETLTYELRNQRWVLLGSLFIVDKSEENINGEWIPREKKIFSVSSASDEEPKKGWLGRMWSKLLRR